jgi:hypothetical protein
VTYKSLFSVDDALASRPHVIDGKEVEPKMSTPRDVCTFFQFLFSDVLVHGLHSSMF